ncbi:hypothetical protein MTO96_038668 [Rhipicephalus appendiculatus]
MRWHTPLQSLASENGGWRFPRPQTQKERTKAAFARLGRIPGVLGCVDGTLIAIQKPHGLTAADTANYMSRIGVLRFERHDHVFTYADSLPAAYIPFIVSRNGTGNRDIWKDTPLGTTRENYIGPDIYAQSLTYDTVLYEDQPNVAYCSIWQNRLMVSLPGYQLTNYHTYEPVPSAPPPGNAPIDIPRGRDSWAGDPNDFATMTTPYPFFSTIWSGWMDSRNRGVTVLMAAGSKAKWIASRDNGQGMYGDGYGFNPMMQPNVPGVPTSGKLGQGAQRAAAFAGNVKRGGASQTPQNNSGDGSTNSPNGSSNPKKGEVPAGGQDLKEEHASPTDDEIQQLFDATEDDELAKHLYPPRTKEDLSIRKTRLGDVLE